MVAFRLASAPRRFNEAAINRSRKVAWCEQQRPCSARFNEAAINRSRKDEIYKYLEPHSELASMRPRSTDRGKCQPVWRPADARRPASMRPRSTDRGKFERPARSFAKRQRSSFNEAAINRSRKGSPCIRMRTFTASMRPRSTDRGKGAAGAIEDFQRLASMRPRSTDRGKAIGRHRTAPETARASMRPRSTDRGKPPRFILFRKVIRGASMRPRSTDRGKPPRASRLSSPDGLQ